MALVHRLFLLILLVALHPGAAMYVPHKVQEADESLADSLAAWHKDGLELLDESGADVEAHSLLKSWSGPVVKYMRNPTPPPKSGEKHNGKAAESSQADPKHSVKAGETPKQIPKAHEQIESIFCRGAGCMVGIVIALAAVPAGILLCSLAICWWCARKRRLSGDQQERTGLIAHSESQNSTPEPPLTLQ